MQVFAYRNPATFACSKCTFANNTVTIGSGLVAIKHPKNNNTMAIDLTGSKFSGVGLRGLRLAAAGLATGQGGTCGTAPLLTNPCSGRQGRPCSAGGQGSRHPHRVAAAQSHCIPATTQPTLCVCAGDTKAGTEWVSLYVVAAVTNAVGPTPSVIVTDPALRLANATELAAEDPYKRPDFGYVYA